MLPKICMMLTDPEDWQMDLFYDSIILPIDEFIAAYNRWKFDIPTMVNTLEMSNKYDVMLVNMFHRRKEVYPMWKEKSNFYAILKIIRILLWRSQINLNKYQSMSIILLSSIII